MSKLPAFGNSVSRNQFRFLDTLGQATRTLAAPADIMATTTRMLGEYLQVAGVAYADIDSDNNRFVVSYGWSADKTDDNVVDHALRDFDLRATDMQQGRPLVIEDAGFELPAGAPPNAFLASGIRAMVLCPLVKDGRIVAATAVHAASPRAWMPWEIALIEEVAERSWAYIERGRSQIALQATERRNAQLAAQLQMALDSAGMGTWRIDPEKNILIPDARFCEIFGISAECLSMPEMAALVHEDDRQWVRAAIEAAAQAADAQPYDLEFRTLRPDGTLRWVGITARPHPGVREISQSFVTLDGTVTDITRRKESEERERQAAARALAAAEANAKFHAFFDQGSYFAAVTMLDGTVVEANRLCLESSGFDRDAIIGRKLWNCGWWNRSSELMEMIRAGIAQAAAGRTFRRETRYFIADGNERLIDLILSPVTDDAGRVLFIAPTGIDITERKAVEAELQDARARLETTLSAAEVATWTYDIEADRVNADRNLARLFGLPEQVAAGAPIGTFLKVMHPDDRNRVADRIKHAIATGTPFESAHRLLTADGNCSHVIARGRVEYDAAGHALRLPGVMIDVTRQKQVEEALRASEERYRALIELMDEAFAIIEVLFDDNGHALDYRFLEVNRAFEQQTGIRNAAGKTARELIPDIEPAWIARYGRVALDGEPARFIDETKALGRWFDVYATRVNDPEWRQVALLFTDITKRKRDEDDLRRLADSLAESDRRKTEFLATLAHELRNPLAPIQSGLDLMRLEPGNLAVATKARGVMERQLDQMIRLVDDLLDMARIAKGKIELKKKRSDLKNVLADAIETSLPLINTGRHEMTVRLPDEPLRMDIDPVRITQVISNLLNNAAKYMRAGGRIELSVRRENHEAVIDVADTGVGIPAHELPTIFDIFVQVRASKDHSQGGLGIGLALVRRLVELHGGSVSASSPGIDQGSTFTVRLPLAEAGPPVSGAAGETASRAAPMPQLRILVVDDNPDAATTMAELLASMGHRSWVAHEGNQALELASEVRPDVAFLDLGLPGMDGYELAGALRHALEDVTLVALTGWGAESDRATTREAGFNHHLTKPASLAAIRELLAGVTQRA